MEQLCFDLSGRIASLTGIKYVFVFLAVFVEGPLATVVAAAIAAGGALRPGPVFLAAALGNLSADISWYTLGYLGRHARLLHRLPWLRNQEKTIRKAEDKMRRHGIRLLIFAKLWFGIVAVPVLIAAGLIHLSWFRVLPTLLFCEIVWTGLLVFSGYHLTSYLGSIENILTRSTLIGVTGIGCVAGIYLLRRSLPGLLENGREYKQ